MKLILKILAGIFVVLILVIVAASFMISADAVKNQVAERIRDQTGRILTVAGDSTVRLLPNPHIELNQVSITDPNARQTAVDFQLPRLDIDLDLIQLLTLRIDASRVIFERPLVLIHPAGVTAKPQNRAALDTEPLLRNASLSSKPGALGHSRFIAADVAGSSYDVQLRDVRIQDGTVRLIDANGGIKREVAHINAAIAMPHIDAPLHAKGDLVLDTQTVNFDVTLNSAGALRQQQPADLVLALSSKLFNASFQGKLVPGAKLAAQGAIKGDTESVKSLLAWRPDAPDARAPVDAALTGNLQWQPDLVSLDNLNFVLGQAKGQGRLALSLAEPKPHLRAALAVGTLDLTPFLPKHSGQPAQAPRPEPTPAPRNPAPSQNGGDFFTNPGMQSQAPAPSAAPAQQPAQRAAPAPQQHMAQASSMAAVALLEADVNANIQQIRVNKIRVGPSSVSLALHDGILTATLGGTKLYGGEGRGKLVIDASRPVPSFTSQLTLDGVSAKPLLTDAAGFELLSGSTKLMLNLAGSGASAEAVKASLNGNGNVAVSDGTISGINLTKMVSDFDQGQVPKIKGGETQFSTMGGSFTVNNGIAHTDNLQMVSPRVNVTAAGDVSIPASMIDMLAKPSIVDDPKAKKKSDLAGVTIPIRIQGPLDRPVYRPELAALMNDPKSATKTINQIGEALQDKFKDKPVGQALGRFLGSVQIGGQSSKKDSDE